MPGMSGKDLSDRLRERHADLRVLFMSGYTDNVMDRYGLDAGGDSLLQKPFNGRELLTAVQEALGRRLDPGAGGSRRRGDRRTTESVEIGFDATQRARSVGDRPRGGGAAGNDAAMVARVRASRPSCAGAIRRLNRAWSDRCEARSSDRLISGP